MSLIRNTWEVGLDSSLEVLSMFWGLACLCGFTIIHNVLEMKSRYFSMNDVILQNERPTTRYHPSKVVRVGMPLGNGRDSALAEPTRPAKY